MAVAQVNQLVLIKCPERVYVLRFHSIECVRRIPSCINLLVLFKWNAMQYHINITSSKFVVRACVWRVALCNISPSHPRYKESSSSLSILNYHLINNDCSFVWFSGLNGFDQDIESINLRIHLYQHEWIIMMWSSIDGAIDHWQAENSFECP